MTNRERILRVMKGEMVDVIPFVPRLDLWWLSNAFKGTLPQEHKGKSHDQIARDEGWALYRMVPDFATMIRGPEDILHRSIGLFSFDQSAYHWEFTGDIEVMVKNEGGLQIVEYHTPLGMLRTVGGLTEEMKRRGASLGWTQEHLIKKPEDYRIAACIFENIRVKPHYDGFLRYRDVLGDEGVVAAGGPSLAASPMHLIQKELIDSTKFYYEYKDHYALMRELADRIENYYESVLSIMEGSPAAVVMWGANYDDTITYPPFFEKEIMPWLRKASGRLGAKGKLAATHTDGENFALMDLLRDSGVHIAESITPSPMTRVSVGEYYRRWKDRLVLFGCIPECILLEETASESEFESYLDMLFKEVAPGDKIIFGIADSTPPNAVFDRLRRIAERVSRECRLPIEAGSYRPVSDEAMRKAGAPVAEARSVAAALRPVYDGVVSGGMELVSELITGLLAKGVKAPEILDSMIAAMETIGERFKNQEIFIPEVLLASRAMNGGLAILEPHLALPDSGMKKRARVLIGTVTGDMHDIGKNMVATMLKGVGFEVRDLGINVSADEFVREVGEYRPDLLGLSALLTTTMPEMKKVIDSLSEKGLRDGLKILVVGAPLNSRYAAEIGADGYAPNASDAVRIARVVLEA